ncbi:hypothetical protein PRUPE_3G003500 [Prunus persica]|uniref:Uncharacterized protein n=1 Tax=Prunus persica TaxID=3760 RepID=A0A251PT93_PRUPE|nr:hypothetical protein PRUPE_3G003500 [Prunus persica]
MNEVCAKANKSVTMPKDTARLWFLNKISFSVSCLNQINMVSSTHVPVRTTHLDLDLDLAVFSFSLIDCTMLSLKGSLCM